MLFKKSISKNIKFNERLPAGNDFDFILRVIGKKQHINYRKIISKNT